MKKYYLLITIALIFQILLSLVNIFWDDILGDILRELTRWIMRLNDIFIYIFLYVFIVKIQKLKLFVLPIIVLAALPFYSLISRSLMNMDNFNNIDSVQKQLLIVGIPVVCSWISQTIIAIQLIINSKKIISISYVGYSLIATIILHFVISFLTIGFIQNPNLPFYLYGIIYLLPYIAMLNLYLSELKKINSAANITS